MLAAGALVVAGVAGAAPAPAGPEPGLVPVTAAELKEALAARRGKVVLVNFWATWCRPCLKEIPDLMALAEELGPEGFELVAVSLDEPADLDRTVRPFLTQFFPELFSYARVDAQMDMTVSVVDPAWNEVLPTSYVIARDGTVAARLQGGKPKEEFRAAVLPLLQGF